MVNAPQKEQIEMVEKAMQVIKPLLDPYQVMDMVLHRGEAAELGELLGLSPRMIRHWCRPPETPEEFTNTGRKGPLNRVGEIIDFIKLRDGRPDRAFPIARHVARRCGGVFFPVAVPECDQNSEATRHIAAILKEVAEAVEEVRKDWFDEDPGRFTPAQQKRVAKEIEEAITSLLTALRWVVEKSDK